MRSRSSATDPGTRAEAGWPPVVVGCLHQTGVNLLRDLSRRGVRVIGIDFNRGAAGFRSIYGEHRCCPNPETDGEAWLEFMRSLALELGQRAVLMCASDQFVMAIGRYASELEPHFAFSAAARLQAALCTKKEQYALVEQHRFPCPRTAYFRSTAELNAFAAAARFPCLFKPLHGAAWADLPPGHPLHYAKASVAENAEELLKSYSSVEPYHPEAVVQELIAGPDTNKYCYLAVYGSDGARLGHCVAWEIRCYPPQLGSASIVQPIEDREIDELCDGFLRSVGYTGVCEIELKRDERDGAVKLIEVNPRFSITGDCSVHAGIEVGWLHYLDLIGMAPAPVAPRRLDFRHVHLALDVPAVISTVGTEHLGWGDLLRSYRGPVAYYDFNPRDRRVTWERMRSCARAAAVMLLRRTGLRRSV